ncbi:MAG: exonuclease domain-containing protein [Salibacteraceae bacterium]
MLFAVVDIETTGGNANLGKITEVAIVITDGETILEEFDSLVDPGMHIPSFITNLTGITNQMVEDAPPFHYIASRVADLLKDKVFVAHNVNFDYSFIKKELEEAGYPMPTKKMCTVRYSRKMVPGRKSYSLGNICSHFGIKNMDAHRAMSDTKATVQLLHELLRLDYDEFWKSYLNNGKEVNLPSGLDFEKFNNLPEKAGVYYLKNNVGSILYIGKAINIKSRISQHFSGKKTSAKSAGFHKEVCDIEYYLTGSEILALLYEDSEIRKHWPPFNKSQKHAPTKYNLSYYKDQKDNWRVGIVKGKFIGKSLLTTYSLMSARECLFELVKQNELSPTLCQISLPVNDHVTDELHNTNFEDLINNHQENPLNFVIWENGRKSNEQAFILIKEGQFHGFGFLPHEQKTTDYSILKEKLQLANPSGITAKYVNNYILTQKDVSLSIIEYNDTQLLF